MATNDAEFKLVSRDNSITNFVAFHHRTIHTIIVSRSFYLLCFSSVGPLKMLKPKQTRTNLKTNSSLPPFSQFFRDEFNATNLTRRFRFDKFFATNYAVTILKRRERGAVVHLLKSASKKQRYLCMTESANCCNISTEFISMEIKRTNIKLFFFHVFLRSISIQLFD